MNKSAMRIRALMLKVAKTSILKEISQTNNAVIIGERLKPIENIKAKNEHKWAHSEYGNLIAKWESNDDYNLCNKTKGGLKAVQGLTLSDYTVSQIQEKQKNRDLFAVGRYQLIPITLNQSIIFLKIKGEQKFDENLQDKIFDDYLIRIKRPPIIQYLEGNGSIENAMYSSAKEWASIGVEKGERISDRNGETRYSDGTQSYYAGDGLNKAHISPEEIKNALIKSKENIQ